MGDLKEQESRTISKNEREVEESDSESEDSESETLSEKSQSEGEQSSGWHPAPKLGVPFKTYCWGDLRLLLIYYY